MSMYEPLRQGFQDLNKMLIDQQVFEAQQRSINRQAERRDRMEQFTLQTQLAQAQRQAKAREYFQNVANGLLTQDPRGNRVNELAQIDRQIPQIQEKLKKTGSGPYFVRERLTLSQNLAALTSHRANIDAELNNPEFMANEHISLASKANKAAVEIAQWDPQQASVFAQLANSHQAQANTYVGVMNALKDSTKDKSQMIKIYDKSTRETLRVVELKSGMPVVLGPNETTIDENDPSSTQLISWLDKNTGEEVGVDFMPKKPGDNFLNASRNKLAKQTGKNPNDLVVHYNKPAETPGLLTEKQVNDLLAEPYSKLDPTGRILGPIEGLGQKISVVRQAFNVSPTAPGERKAAIAFIQSTLNNMEIEYWKNRREIESSGAGRKEIRDAIKELDDLFITKQKILTSDSKGKNGIYYTPDYNTASNLGITP